MKILVKILFWRIKGVQHLRLQQADRARQCSKKKITLICFRKQQNRSQQFSVVM